MSIEIIKTCEQIHAETIERIKESMSTKSITGIEPRICIVQVGNNPASNAYVRGKMKDLDAVGIYYELRVISENIRANDFAAQLLAIGKDSAFTGVIVQLPLPEHLRSVKVSSYIDASKDVDGFRSDSAYVPCTPAGIMMFLSANKISLDGRIVTIINRSEIVGKPLAQMMQDANATVMVAHSHTDPGYLRDIMIPNSDIIVTAVGKRCFIRPQDVCGEQLIIDVGINQDENGKMCGDCARNLGLINGYQTPVPKGVGLLTRAAFLINCYNSGK